MAQLPKPPVILTLSEAEGEEIPALAFALPVLLVVVPEGNLLLSSHARLPVTSSSLAHRILPLRIPDPIRSLGEVFGVMHQQQG
jgi:hypothetical protein